MTKPYDATTKDLIEGDPAGWVEYFGRLVPRSAVTLVDADLSTVTTDADKVIRVAEAVPWILHLEIQTDDDPQMARRLLRYNAMLQLRHEMPVATAVVLLNPSRRMPELTGAFEVRPPVGTPWEFRYEVVRVWERPADEFLTGPLGLLPLAPLAAVRRADLPRVVAGMRERIDAGAERPYAAKLWASAFVLAGLRYDGAVAEALFAGVMQMEQSSTYQLLIKRGMAQGLEQGLEQGIATGRTREAFLFLMRMGKKKFGKEPTQKQRAALAAITDLERLEFLGEKLLDVSTWGELLKPD